MHMFSPEDIASFEQSDDFLDFMTSSPVLSDTFAAGIVIVNWIPRV